MSETDSSDSVRSGGPDVIVSTKKDAFEAMKEGETVFTRLRHYWCALGPGEYPEEREEPLVTEDGEILGKRWVCTACGQPVHFLTGPVEVDRDV